MYPASSSCCTGCGGDAVDVATLVFLLWFCSAAPVAPAGALAIAETEAKKRS